jgi:hypothetical protein
MPDTLWRTCAWLFGGLGGVHALVTVPFYRQLTPEAVWFACRSCVPRRAERAHELPHAARGGTGGKAPHALIPTQESYGGCV